MATFRRWLIELGRDTTRARHKRGARDRDLERAEYNLRPLDDDYYSEVGLVELLTRAMMVVTAAVIISTIAWRLFA